MDLSAGGGSVVLSEWRRGDTVGQSERPATVLVVDDEENIRFLVQSALELAGITAIGAADGHTALRILADRRIDLVVLDVMMPGLDGFGVLGRLRDRGSRVPVIFLTARDATDDRVRGLTSGGDDYMVKPFAVAELVARVELRLRTASAATRTTMLRCGDLALDTDAHRVTRSDTVIDLSPTEYNLLHHLLLNSGRVLSRAQLLEQVWGYESPPDSSVVDTYISYLRRKLDQEEPKLIHTVRGIGFCLRVGE